MKFSDFAQIIYSIAGGEKYGFTIELLKAGLDEEGIDIIKSLKDDKSGKSRIRKFLSGDNDITEIAPEIVNYFYDNLFIEYIEEIINELQYDEICEKFKEVSANQIIIEEDVPERLAEIYHDILNEAAKGKSLKVKNDVSPIALNSTKIPDNTAANCTDIGIIQSYTIIESEKKAIKNICNLVNNSLRMIKFNTNDIERKQFELKNLTDSEANKLCKEHLEYSLNVLKERFNASYSELEEKCADIVKLLESKKHLNKSLNKIYDIAHRIGSNEYKITHPDAFSYSAFSLMVSDFQKNFDLLLRVIDEL